MAEQDIKGASETYSGFVNLFKFGTISLAIVAAVVVLLIS